MAATASFLNASSSLLCCRGARRSHHYFSLDASTLFQNANLAVSDHPHFSNLLTVFRLKSYCHLKDPAGTAVTLPHCLGCSALCPHLPTISLPFSSELQCDILRGAFLTPDQVVFQCWAPCFSLPKTDPVCDDTLTSCHHGTGAFSARKTRTSLRAKPTSPSSHGFQPFSGTR